MINEKSSKILKLVAIISLIAVFSIAGIIACSGDGITGGGGRGYYSSVGDSGNTPSTPDNNPNLPGDNTNSQGTNATPSLPGGDTNSGGTDSIPSLPDDNPGDYYDVRVPFAVGGNGNVSVSYKDTNKLRQLWFDSINRKAANDGKVFAIRNRGNDGDPNNFQNRRTHGRFSAYDYYYFNENGDIVWKEDNTIIKKFMGATIVRYRDITIDRGHYQLFGNNYNRGAIVNVNWKERGPNTVGAIYANTMTTEQARQKYHWDKTGNDPFKDGVFDFITSRWLVEDFHNGWRYENGLFERQYTTTGFIEILVMYDYDNLKGGTAAAVHSYYPYYGDRNTTKGFTPQNMPYMTNHNIYIGQRPEFTMNKLNHTTLFTDFDYRYWEYMFMPGHKN